MSTPLSAAPHRVLGTITGTINGTSVNMSADIVLNYTNGLETAVVSNVPASLGSSLRAYTTLVTLAGPVGGVEVKGPRTS